MKKFCPTCEEMLKVNGRDPSLGHCNGCGWSGHLGMAHREPGLPPVPPRLPYVSVDIETTGLDPDICQTLEIGVVREDWKSPIDKLNVFRRVLIHDEVRGSPFAMALNANLLKFIACHPKEKAVPPQEALNQWVEKCGLSEDKLPIATLSRVLGNMQIPWPEVPNQLLRLGADVPEAMEIGANPPGTSCFCFEYEFAELLSLWLKAQGMDPKSVQAAGKNFAAFDMQFLNRLPCFGDYIKFRHRVIDPAILYWQMDDERLPDSKTCYERAGHDETVAHTAVEDAKAVVWLVRQGVKRLRNG